MAEKQFKCHLAVVGVHIGVGTDEHDLTGDECRDLLNELSTENRQLKKENKKYQNIMKKYGITTIEKLDRILFEQKVW